MTAQTPEWTTQELEELATAAGIDLRGSDRVARAGRRLRRDLVGRTRDEAGQILDAWTVALEAANRSPEEVRQGRSAVAYHRLSPRARQEIQWAGLTVAAYVREWYPDGQWGGDRCGCPDDRCRGHHHGVGEPCGCLASLIAERAPVVAVVR